MLVYYSFMIYLTRWRCISTCSKRLRYFSVPTCLKLLFVVSATNLLCHVSFSAPIHLMICSLKIVLLIPLKYHTGTGVADYYNMILLRLNLEVHIFHCSRGGRLVALVGVCIVWNLETLASGGQSSHKLIPHIICQFLYAREKTLNEDLFDEGSSASLPRLHTCENKVPFLGLENFRITVTKLFV